MGKKSEIALNVRRRYQEALKKEKKAEKEIEYLRKKLKRAKLVHRNIKEEKEELRERAIALASYGY